MQRLGHAIKNGIVALGRPSLGHVDRSSGSYPWIARVCDGYLWNRGCAHLSCHQDLRQTEFGAKSELVFFVDCSVFN